MSIMSYVKSLSVCMHALWVLSNQIEQYLSLVIESTQDVADVVGEETLVVQHDGCHLGHGRGAHLLVVVMAVSLHSHLSNLEEFIIVD